MANTTSANNHLSIDSWFDSFIDACEGPPPSRDAFFNGAIAAARLFADAIALTDRSQSMKRIEQIIAELSRYDSEQSEEPEAIALAVDRFVEIGHAIRDREAPAKPPMRKNGHHLTVHKGGAK